MNIPPSKERRFLPSRLCRDLSGFLLLPPSFRVHLAADPGVTRPSYVDGADQVGIFREARLDTSKLRLRLAVLLGNVTTSSTDHIEDRAHPGAVMLVPLGATGRNRPPDQSIF